MERQGKNKLNKSSFYLEKYTLQKEVFTTHEIAELLQVDSDTIYEMVLNRELPFKRVGNQIRFYKCAVLEWLFKDSI
jgi:excisionase family DNA binding protein